MLQSKEVIFEVCYGEQRDWPYPYLPLVFLWLSSLSREQCLYIYKDVCFVKGVLFMVTWQER